jgi:hypothetical protein
MYIERNKREFKVKKCRKKWSRVAICLLLLLIEPERNVITAE